MTFKELQEKIGPQVESEWHQHTNGGGWVHKSATVSDSAYIGDNAVVLSGNAWIYGNAQISGNARISGNAQISGDVSPLRRSLAVFDFETRRPEDGLETRLPLD